MITTKKFNYLLILINCILIVSIGAFFFSGRQLPQSRVLDFQSSDSTSSSSEMVKRANLERDYYSKSVESFDIEQCDNLSNELKEICSDDIYINKAYIESDISLCSKISNPKLKKQCLDRLDQ